VLLIRAGRSAWPESDSFGAENVQPEDELLILKEIYLTDFSENCKYIVQVPIIKGNI
jgi:hypothetical protein